MKIPPLSKEELARGPSPEDLAWEAELQRKLWCEELEPWCLKVQEILAAVWPRAIQQLDDTERARLATGIAELVRNIAEPASRSEVAKAYDAAREQLHKAAKTFLRELESSPYYHKEFGQNFVEPAHRAVKRVANFTGKPVNRPSDNNAAALWLATLVEQAWRHAGINMQLGWRPPGKDREKDKAGTLTRAVTKLLALGGVHIPENTVSGYLRNRPGGGGKAHNTPTRGGKAP